MIDAPTIEELFSLREKNVFIVGATAGFGLIVAASFAKSGARVTMAGRRDARKEAEEIGARYAQLDARDPAAFERVLKESRDAVGPFDALILNQGAYGENFITKTEPSVWDNIIDTNLKGMLYGLKFGAPYVKDGGSIVMTASIAGVRGMPRQGVYSATKEAIVSLARVAAIELGPRGIRVNAVCPAAILSDRSRTYSAEGYSFVTQMNRAGSGQEMVGAFAFLASDASKFVTGSTVTVDGGMLAGMSWTLSKITGEKLEAMQREKKAGEG
jgi:NAD(P)-dependent dehydrogenase (short-subunit alcohol dehydrogenase family)